MDEYRARTDLLDEKGRLTRSRRSAYDTYIYNKEDARGKLSEWERCFVFGPRFALEIDYGHTPRAGIAEVRLTDFETDEQLTSGGVHRFPGDAFDLDFSCGEEHTVKYENGDLYLLLTLYDGVRRVKIRSSRFEGDFSCADDGLGLYTTENLGARRFLSRGFRCHPELSGFLRVNNLDYVLDGRTFFYSESVRGAWAGKLPYLRGFGSTELPGGVLSITVSDGEDGAPENALFYGGEMIPLSRAFLKQTAPGAGKLWYISDSERRLHLRFTPEHEYTVRRRPFLAKDELHQTFGTLSGTADLPDGEHLIIEDMPFCCEEH